MSIFERMQQLTKGITSKDEESNELINAPKAQIGDTIQGIITNIIYPDEVKGKKGGFGFIASKQLPYERIFFHWSSLRQDTLRFPKLEKKMKVEFKLLYSEPFEEHEGGFTAVNIRVIE